MSGKVTCRCCFTWSADKDLKARNKWLGITEVYADMLKECFDIHINIGQEPTERGICYSCILRLRDAYNFKRQVLQCLKEFENHLQNGPGVIKGQILPKQRIPLKHEATYEDEIIDGDDSDSFFSDSKEDIEDHDDGDSKTLATSAIDQLTKRQAATKEVTINKLPKPKPKERELKTVVDRKPVSVNQRIRMEESPTTYVLLKQKENILNFMKYSNVTPFFAVTYNGIQCAHCKKAEKDLESLKLHNKTHENLANVIFSRKGVHRQPLKLDITDLKCNLCDEHLDVVTNLKKHLTDQHDIKMYDVKGYYMEFKASSLDCALCSTPFETFRTLQQHMNVHYRNFICDECGSGYINQFQLLNHIKTHSKNEFQCSHCHKVFNTKEKRYYHEKAIHSASKIRFITKCPLCTESFTHYYQRNMHMVKVHKTAAATYKCNVCDRSFLVKDKLTKHIKRDHLMEKNHSCEECGMQFHTKQSLKSHMIKHNGAKLHKCTVCSKSYTRKKVLKEHMRIHLNDRRFKCGLCELAFVQKCSLKGHMLSNHGISLSEYEKTDQSELENT